MRLKLHGELAEQSIIVVRGAQTSSSPSNYLFCLSPRYCRVIFLIERIKFLYRGLVKKCRCLRVVAFRSMPYPRDAAMDHDARSRKYSDTRENVLRMYRINVSRVTETGRANFVLIFYIITRSNGQKLEQFTRFKTILSKVE